MKKAVIIMFVALSASAFFAFRIGEFSPSVKVKEYYVRSSEEFQSKAEEFKNLADQRADQNKLIDTFKELRKSYKRIEFLLTYFDLMLENELNRANIPYYIEDVPPYEPSSPRGLQVIEELITADNPDFREIDAQNKFLVLNARSAVRLAERVDLNDRHVFEAWKNELVRIQTMGITGFDSPVLAYSLEECKAALSSIETSFNFYNDFLADRISPKAVKKVSKLLDKSIKYLEGKDFDTFDRLTYIKDNLEPLRKALYDLHITSEIPTIKDLTDKNIKSPYNGSHLFDEDFLNVYAFSRKHSLSYDEKRVELGKMLFFDPVLSKNNQRSCASCHNPEMAFTDGEKKSVAFDFEGTVDRNSPSIINSAYQNAFFHDMRAPQLERQIAHVTTSHKEFNTSYDDILKKLEASEEYKTLFNEAYATMPEDKKITVLTFTGAIADYIRSISAFNSPFDQYMRGELASIDESVIHGFNLFMGKAGCGTCHFAPVFNGTVPPLYQDSEGEVLGVPETPENKKLDPDMGRYNVLSGLPFMKNAFKTPTVRNIALTAPYMHNGVYENLEQVMEFYDQGGGLGMGLDVPNRTLPPDPLNLTEEEEESIIAFMKALTDTVGLTSRPVRLPDFPEEMELNARKIGGEY